MGRIVCVHHLMYVAIVTYDSYSFSVTVDASRDNYTSSGKGTNTEGACSSNKYVHEQLNEFIYNRHMHFLVCKILICTYHRALF